MFRSVVGNNMIHMQLSCTDTNHKNQLCRVARSNWSLRRCFFSTPISYNPVMPGTL